MSLTFADKDIESIGVGSFGPIDPVKGDPTYGRITTTPKPHWSNYNIVKALEERFNVPIGFDTDVNGAALGEYTRARGDWIAVCISPSERE